MFYLKIISKTFLALYSEAGLLLCIICISFILRCSFAKHFAKPASTIFHEAVFLLITSRDNYTFEVEHSNKLQLSTFFFLLTLSLIEKSKQCESFLCMKYNVFARHMQYKTIKNGICAFLHNITYGVCIFCNIKLIIT